MRIILALLISTVGITAGLFAQGVGPTYKGSNEQLATIASSLTNGMAEAAARKFLLDRGIHCNFSQADRDVTKALWFITTDGALVLRTRPTNGVSYAEWKSYGFTNDCYLFSAETNTNGIRSYTIKLRNVP